jgi:hypothetical protein
MNYVILARIYALVAEMEALKAEMEALKREWPESGEWLFREKASQLTEIANQLQQLG